MPNNIFSSLGKFQHNPQSHSQHVPHKWTTPTYGTKIQYSLQPSSLPIPDKKRYNCIQSINGTFLYYARKVDPSMIPAINKCVSQQENNNNMTSVKCLWATQLHIHPPKLDTMQVTRNYTLIQMKSTWSSLKQETEEQDTSTSTQTPFPPPLFHIPEVMAPFSQNALR